MCGTNSYHVVGVMTLFLPPYSPDLNPIKLSFSACKSVVRSRHFITNTTYCRKSLSLTKWAYNSWCRRFYTHIIGVNCLYHRGDGTRLVQTCWLHIWIIAVTWKWCDALQNGVPSLYETRMTLDESSSCITPTQVWLRVTMVTNTMTDMYILYLSRKETT